MSFWRWNLFQVVAKSTKLVAGGPTARSNLQRWALAQKMSPKSAAYEQTRFLQEQILSPAPP